VLTFKIIVLTTLLATSGLGCNQVRTACSTELGVSISPRVQTVLVGGVVRPKVRLTSCGGREVLRDELTWTSNDPTVANVDVLGTIAGASPGTTTVDVAGRTYGRLGSITITVAGGGS
jgi:uncharacterized protein YjdB